MSEIQRFEFKNGQFGFVDTVPSNHGRYCLYSDLSFYRRQYHMAVCALVVVCAVFAAFLVTGKHAPQPMAKQASVESVQPWQAVSEKLDELTSSLHQAGAALDKLNRHADSERAAHQKIQALHESHLKEQDAKLEALNKPEAILARPMHDGELFKLAKQVGGFTKIRVVE